MNKQPTNIRQIPREVVGEMNSLFGAIQEQILTLSPEKVRAVLSRLRDIAEGKAERVTIPPIPKSFSSRYFVSPTEQMVNVLKWSEEFGWGMDEGHFSELSSEPPTWPSGELSAVVLAVYLDTVEATYNALWQVINRNLCGRKPAIFPFRNSGPGKVELAGGQSHPGRCLRWEVISFGKNRFDKHTKPADARDERSPHAAILSAAAHFPEWLIAMDGDKVPFVWLHGYKVRLGNDQPWPQRVPRLGWDSNHIDLSLELLAEGRADPSAIFPVRLE